MKKFAFINTPSQELERPPAAAALLSSIIRSIGWDCKIFDFNLFLNSKVDETAWIELEQYWRCKIETISEGTRSQLIKTLELFLADIKQYDPDWIGISVFSRFSTVSCYEFLKYIRPRIEATIMIGGHGIGAWPGSLPNVDENTKYKTIADYLKEENFIDHYIIGDGEDSMKELLQGDTTKNLQQV